MKTLSLVAIFLTMLVAAGARADVTCTLQGTLKYAPADYYYCDTNLGTCSGWLATDLDNLAAGVAVPFLKVVVRNVANTATLATTYTNAAGFFKASFILAGVNSCASSSVKVRREFIRVHEADATASSPRFRFRIVDRSSPATTQISTTTLAIALTDNNNRTQTWNDLVTATDTSDKARWHGVYYTMNSAITEIVKWSTAAADPNSLTNQLASTVTSQVLQVRMDSGDVGIVPSTDTNPNGFGKITLGWEYYAGGGTIRHELGHWIHQLMHRKNQAQNDCRDSNFGNVSGHTPTSCEYGERASAEGMADFIATRSITSNDTNAWICAVAANGMYGRDACSELAMGRLLDSGAADGNDGIGVSAGVYVYKILGDSYANSSARCAVPDSASCGCGNGCNTTANRSALGYRIQTNISRFLWDLIDTSTDSNQDDINMSISSLVTAWMGMPCDKNDTATWKDGSCNEPYPPLACKKDKYNPFDFAQMLPGDESQERTLNCVQNAVD